jgi:glutamate N-acetyltransferase/amino-acid N-acetyltransferase
MTRVNHITVPGGFVAAGVHCGIKTTDQEDLTILAAEKDAAVAIVTTRNQIVGAPILWNRGLLPRGYGKARAIVANSGNSNVCTGRAGLRDAETMAALTARQLGCERRKVLVASTGIIGQRLPMAKVRAGIADAASRLGRRNDAAALRGIMTTDTREKSAVVQTRIGGRLVTVAGLAKGAGMIAPSMATMISLITTDAAISPAGLHRALLSAAAGGFHAITIDSDTSTSDTVALFASGAAGNRTIAAGRGGFAKFAAALGKVCGELARAMVLDGEGATKLVEVAVRGARSGAEAKAAARSVADSPLVKTAVHGGDPNWGRIAMALGKSAAKVVAEKLRIRIGGVLVFSRGCGRKFDVRKVERHMGGKKVRIDCDLGLGNGRFTALTCDLSREYVTINADYHT